jgi:riboflavin transporter FmnP
MAFVLMAVGRVPMVLFLKYDPKDVVILIGGLIYGPLSAMAISLVVSFVERITISDTGWIGLLMNVLSTCAFVCTASYIYKKKQNLTGAVTGLVIGGALTVVVMLLWNYLVVPIYTPYISREQVVPLLWKAFLPFNAIKVSINGAVTMLIYKPIVRALRRANLIPPSNTQQTPSAKAPIGALVISAGVLITCIVYVLVLNGVI